MSKHYSACVNKIKWTGVGHLPLGNYKMFSPEMTNSERKKRKGVALILRQDVAQAVGAMMQVSTE